MRPLMLSAVAVAALFAATPLAAQRVDGLHAGLDQLESRAATPQFAGDRARVPRTTFISSGSREPPPAADSLVHRRSYWLTGMVVGAVVGLVSGLQLQHQLCGDPGANPCTGTDHLVFVIPMTLLGFVGGLIGSSIHRQ